MTDLEVPAGCVFTTTFGSLKAQTHKCLSDMRSFSEQHGLKNVSWDIIPGSLVEKARNDAVRQMIARGGQWLLFVDGDMIFQPDALLRLLNHAFGPNGQQIDAIGGYCTLKGDMALPTIDSGTGTWESWFPGSGIVEVMRTGGAFILCKRSMFAKMPEPWFRMRVPARPIDFMFEVDNWARMKLDGQNPFKQTKEWQKLEALALSDPSVHTFVPNEVGEDSGFCDMARAYGLRIFVDTDTVVGHLDEQVLTPTKHREAMDNMRKSQRLLSGMLA